MHPIPRYRGVQWPFVIIDHATVKLVAKLWASPGTGLGARAAG